MACEKDLASEAGPGLKTVVDMARWRYDFLAWQAQAERARRNRLQATADPPQATP